MAVDGVMRGVIDRIVDKETVVVHVGPDEQEYLIAAEMLPEGAGEGTVLFVELDKGTVVSLRVDCEQTAAQRHRLQQKLDRLRERGRRKK